MDHDGENQTLSLLAVLSENHLEFPIPLDRVNTTHATSLRQALSRIAHVRFDCVLISNDLATLDEIREFTASTTAAVILSDKPSDPIPFLKVGVREFLTPDQRTPSGIELTIKTAIARQTHERALHPDHFESLVSSLIDALIVVDDQGCIRWVNPVASELFKQTERELIDVPFGFPIAPSPTVLDIIRPGPAGPETVRAEMRAASIRWDGRPASLATLRDVTARLEAEDAREQYRRELERTNRELDEYASVVSHDLRDPVRTVITYTEMVQRNLSPSLKTPAGEWLDLIHDASLRMRDLINDLERYARLDSNQVVTTPISTQRVLEEAVENLAASINATRAKISVKSSLPLVQGDHSRILQLFQNLLSNSIRFSGNAPPQITIESEQEGTRAHFTVRDRGIGIAPQHHERVFQVFSRLPAARNSKGTGIGLAICRKIVEQHGGRIFVESEPGKGSSFHFWLPRPPRRGQSGSVESASEA